MPLGIDFSLTTPQSISATLSGFEVTSFAVDFIRGEMVIAYDRVNSAGNKIGEEKAITVEGQELTDAWARAQQLATQQSETVARALTYVLHELVRDRLGAAGTINAN